MAAKFIKHNDNLWHMQHDILYKPAYTLLEVKLETGEKIEAESGAMVYMSPGIEITTKAKGGVLGALTRYWAVSLFSRIPFPQSQKVWLVLLPRIRVT